MRQPRTAHAERLGSAFDLLAGRGGGGVFMERDGVGVAGAGGDRWVTVLDGTEPKATAEMVKAAFAGIDRGGSDPVDAVPILFGSLAFDPRRPSRFVLPSRAVLRDRDGQTWSIEVRGPGDRDEAPPAGRHAPFHAPHAPFSGLQLRPDPPPDRYSAAVAEAVRRIRAGDLRKVVLARTIEVTAGRMLDPAPLLRHLRAVEPQCYVFGFDDGEGCSLVGASPELLVSKVGRRVRSNPLAGSAPRFGDPDRDRASGEALLASAKEREEHAIVVDAVEASLAPFCDELDRDPEPVLLPTANVWHLSTRFRGILEEPAPDALTLAAALHPTPAVGGTPDHAAAALIRDLEPFDRGGYAGPIGWVDANGDGTWAIALRCAELRGDVARLFAGAGIVADSLPEDELDETERKFRAFLDSLRWG